MKNFDYCSPSIYFSYCKYIICILMFVYVVLKAKFLKVAFSLPQILHLCWCIRFYK